MTLNTIINSIKNKCNRVRDLFTTLLTRIYLRIIGVKYGKNCRFLGFPNIKKYEGSTIMGR